MKLGLRIDVDTLRGTRRGVPQLLSALKTHRIRTSFFFSLGPDNMGRHLWRLRHFDFLKKMLRSKAPSLYGWDILWRGTFWPGPMIGARQAPLIRAAAADDHEIGLHAWDHHAWQVGLEQMTIEDIEHTIDRGVSLLTAITGRPPIGFASPGWRCNQAVIRVASGFGFSYCSDCRGTSIFRPSSDDDLCPPQIPVTLPTYDEVIGRAGVTDTNYNGFLLDQLRPDALNVLTVHAEVEGIACAAMFTDFLKLAAARGIEIVALGDLLPPATTIPAGHIAQGTVDGRHGTLCVQSTEEGHA